MLISKMSPIKITRLSEALKKKISSLSQQGLQPTAITKVILAEEGISVGRKSVRLYLQRRLIEERNGYPTKRQPQPERRKLTQEHLDFIHRTLKEDDETTGMEMQTKLRETFGLTVSLTTVGRARRSLGWTCTSTKYGQTVREVNQEKRMKFCRDVIKSQENYDDVVFTDESTIRMQQYVRRCFRLKGHQRKIKGVPKHPYQVHVWAGISRRGATGIAIFSGRMDSAGYQSILRKFLLPFGENVYPDGYRLYQDNDPKHKSKSTTQWLKDQNVKVMEAPPESPDLNPIEMIWADLKYHLRRHVKPRTKEALILGIVRYWRALEPEKLERYINHLYKVVPKVLQARGKPSGC